MPSVRLITHPYYNMHDPGDSNHPENSDRLEKAMAGLSRYGVLGLAQIDPPPEPGSIDDYRLVHDDDYISWLKEEMESALTVKFLDPDTYISPGTLNAVNALAGAVRRALSLIGASIPVILGRPPGHHAGSSGAALGAPTLGFCHVNTSALIAARLAETGRVAVLDFDVHHGNGTQEILDGHPRIIHVDVHQHYSTIYPGTGEPSYAGKGNLYNINLPPGSGDDIASEALGLALEIVRSYRPDYVVVSAGFDLYSGDNNFSNLKVTSSTLNDLGRKLSSLGAGIVVVLEGGYGRGLERGLPAFIAGLAGAGDPVGEEPRVSSGFAWRSFREGLKGLESSHAEIKDLI